jgi:hypothetical protein
MSWKIHSYRVPLHTPGYNKPGCARIRKNENPGRLLAEKRIGPETGRNMMYRVSTQRFKEVCKTIINFLVYRFNLQ